MPRKTEVTPTVKMILMTRAGGFCTFDGCTTNLIATTTNDGTIHLSEAAHIYPLSDAGPRGGEEGVRLSISARNSPENLMLLCGHHHILVDKAPASYPAEELRRMKDVAEAKIQAATRLATTDVTFTELDAVCKRLIHDQTVLEWPTELNKTAIESKRIKHGLSDQTKTTLYAGLSIAARVKAFISEEASNDESFPRRLVAGFRKHYYANLQKGITGDALFSSLVVVASGGILSGDSRHSAGVAVLSYLFQLCEVFEP